MIHKIRRAFGPIWPEFYHKDTKLLDPYLTFRDYRKIWAVGISVLVATALVPLLVVTVIHYQLLEKSVDSELRLRTERLASNARRAVTFFLEERLDALQFTINEIDYDRLINPDNLAEILRNLKLGFGGLTDLSVIADTGKQIAYAGPYNLEGRDYSNQRWFVECRNCIIYVSEVFRGYRDVPHIIIAIKSFLPNGSFFILRATLDTDRLIQVLKSYETGSYAHIFLVNRSGIVQTPSQKHGDIFQKMPLPVPKFSMRTRVKMAKDDKDQPLIVGYAYIFTRIADTPYILMVIKHKARMMQVWEQFRSNINWFVGLGTLGAGSDRPVTRWPIAYQKGSVSTTIAMTSPKITLPLLFIVGFSVVFVVFFHQFVGRGVGLALLEDLLDFLVFLEQIIQVLSAGLTKLGQSALYCVTEVHTQDDIDRLTTALTEVCA